MNREPDASATRLVVSPYLVPNARIPRIKQIEILYDNEMDLTTLQAEFLSTAHTTLLFPNVNRFYKRTVFEVATLIPTGGILEVVLEDNEHLTLFGLKALFDELFPTQFAYIATEQVEIGRRTYHGVRYVRRPSKGQAPESTGWSLGVLCLKTDPDYLRRMESSVVTAAQVSGMDNVEILLYSSDGIDYSRYLTQIPGRVVTSLDAESDYIGRKKNAIFEAAKYSEVAIFHDRFLLSERFFDHLHWHGYRFALSAVRVRLPNGRRGLDWAVVSSQNRVWSSGGLLPYRAYSDYVYVPGGFTVLRKDLWSDAPWSHSLRWNEHEDVELTRRFQRQGGVVGLAKSTVVALKDRWLNANALLPLDDRIEVLPGVPVGEMRISFLR